MEQNEHINRPRRRSPFQRNRRLQSKYLSWLLIGAMVLFTVLGVISPDRDFSENENRKLAGFPELSFSSVLDGSVLKDLGSYVADQFPMRDLWISLNLWMNRTLGWEEASGVYFCADDYLIQAPSAPHETQHQRNLDAISAFAEKYPNLNTVMTIVPNAVTIHSDKLPAFVPARDQMVDLAHIRDQVTGVNFVDVTQTLLDHKDEQLFYRTDHHWTSLAASYAFEQIAPALNIHAPSRYTYDIYTVSKSFAGTLSSKSGAKGIVDQVEVFAPQTDIEYFVTYGNDKNGICSMYNRQALEGKDHYTVFFGGNYGRVDITTTADTGRVLLVFKDSYANCFMQFIYPYFDHIVMIDPRYYYENVDNVLKSEGVTDILYLYNLDTFLGDTSLADVLNTGN